MTTNTIDMNRDYFNNPLKILHRLREAGFTQEQAEAQTEVITNYVGCDLATKQDILSMKQELKQDLKQDILNLRLELKELELRMTYKITAIIGLFYALNKFF